tara:strand:+ start:5650 stop:6789 length:1140 start_codon:yes stop_codon:yes gene_type:complete
MLNIKKYNLPYSKEDIEYVQKHIELVLKNGYLTDGGEYVKNFESTWSDIINVKNSIAVNSCTTALEIILKAIDVRGHSVVVPTYTFFATPLSVHNAGAEVIYADISKETFSLSLETIKSSIKDNTKAIIIVHVGGIVSNEIQKIKDYCDERDIFLIEDAACAHGASYEGKSVGSIGHYGAFSFHHSKVLTTGEGGMITSNKDDLIQKMLRIRAIGLDRSVNNFEVFELGNNYKMSEITAVLGLLHCKNSKNIFNERRELAKFYDNNIELNNGFSKFMIPDRTTSAYYKYIIFADSKEKKQKFTDLLKQKYNIHLPPTTYEYLCHEQKINKKIKNITNQDYKNARHLMETNVCLPMYCGLSLEERSYIIESINEVVNEEF